MRVLITAFEPFDSDTTNSSLEAVTALPDIIAEAEIVKMTLPVAFDKSIDCLREAIEEYRPGVIICVGQAGGHFGITPERVAINVMDASKPDNDGQQPHDVPIVDGGPTAYFSKLPIKAMISAMQEEGLPSSVSNSAGTFVCNQLMYGLMHIIHTEHPEIIGGFIHVPYTPAQAAVRKNMPSMAVNDMTKGLTICIVKTLKLLQ